MSANDPLWYRDAIIYELHVRAFHDSDGDGRGDFRGLTEKLDYLQDLGVTALWLLPFYPSPLKDDGYDIADYTDVHPQYGRLDDFRAFLDAAHDRGLRVINELVLNHTSDQHPWFQRARRAPAGSPERDFYVWNDSPEKYREARVIFQDFEPSNWSWDPVAKAYYWHRFYAHQPDLNFDNQAVWEALLPIVDFWMEMGVDGMRLDAVPYLFEREGTNCENLPETHGFLKALRAHVDARYPGRMFLAEANQWPEDAVAYFGDGDECHMSFHFPLMPRLFMALHQEDRFPIHDIMAQTPAIPEGCQWCFFLRNHDELTLEMVTDEERDYMYGAYARDRTARINLGIRHRLAPLLGNNRRRIELMTALLFALPGTPVLYYGDEIGMGDNIYLGDRNGVRTPMQWSGDRNAGFSRANPQMLYLPVVIDPEYHYETVNVEAHQGNPSSLLWWVKRLIALRKESKAFGRGSFELLRPDNPRVLAFVREFEGERILVVANLSRFVQCARLDLKAYSGSAPEEMLGRSSFPAIGDLPYLLTLGPHAFLWLSLSRAAAAGEAMPPGSTAAGGVAANLPVLRGARRLADRFRPSHWEEIEDLLPGHLMRNRSLPDSAEPTGAEILRAAPMRAGDLDVWLLVARIDQRGGASETLSLGLAFIPEGRDEALLTPLELAGFARLEGPEPGLLCDALAVSACCRDLLANILAGRSFGLKEGEIGFVPLAADPLAEPEPTADLAPSLRVGQSGSSTICYGESFVLRMFGRMEEGVDPGLETARFLTERTEYRGAAPLAGFVEYRRRGAAPATLGVLRRFVSNQGTAWQYTLDQLSQYFERVLAPGGSPASHVLGGGTEPGRAAEEDRAGRVEDLIGGYLDAARRLGERTAELHDALAGDRFDPAFAPEPFGKLYQRSLYQSLRNLTGRLCDRLAGEHRLASDEAAGLAEQVVRRREEILQRFRAVLDPAIDGWRTRCHGSFHLRRLLYTGKDFVVTDFAGEGGRTFGERRLKRSPLRDVAGLMSSFDSAAQSVRLGLSDARGRSPGIIRAEDRAALGPWADAWRDAVSREFLSAYRGSIRTKDLLPSTRIAGDELLRLLLLEKALQEIDAELTARPAWAEIPLRAVLQALEPNRRGSIVAEGGA